MASPSKFPDGFKKDRNTSSDSNISKDDLVKVVETNNETLKALQTIGKGIDTVLFSENKAFDTYLSEIKDITEKQQELEDQIEAERKQNDKKNKEELRLLLKQIAILSGLKEDDVAKALSDKTSELFQNLPEELSSALEVLLNDDKKLLSTIVEENKQRLEEEKQFREEEREKSKKFFSNFIEKTNSVFEKNSSTLSQAMFGPVNLLLGPMEEFFNFSAIDMAKGFLFGKEGGRGEEKKEGLIPKLGKKLFKKRPTPNDVANTGDMGSLLINNTLQDVYGKSSKKDKEGDGGLTDDIFGTMAGSLFAKAIPGLLAALPAFLATATPIIITAALAAGLLSIIFTEAGREAAERVKTASQEGLTKGTEFAAQKVEEGAPHAERYGQAVGMASSYLQQKPWITRVQEASDKGDYYATQIMQLKKDKYNALNEGMFKTVVSNIAEGKIPETPTLQRAAERVLTYHIGGVIGERNAVGSINDNYIMAQKGEVILPISESNYGLQSGILQPTSIGGMEINKEFKLPSYNAPAISLQSPNTSVSIAQATESIRESTNSFTTTNIESKLDSMINLLQSLLSKEPIIIPPSKQSNSDLELLIYGGAF
ncbi:MAG: hypothetical protein AB7V16_07410 [Vulcanibacillus sp.]